MANKTRTADETLTDLRRKLLHWEGNLQANLARYTREKSERSAFSARTQLGIVQDVLDEIGR